MNAGKYKVMVGSSDGNIIVNYGTSPVMCTVCKRWIHKRYSHSGVLGNLSLVVDGFRYN